MREENPLLQILNLEVSYNQVHALRGVDAQIFLNEIVVLVGSNGAGKSTLLNTIIGLVKAQKGKILFKGKEIRGLKSNEIVSLGITLIPEGRKVFPDQTIDENLSLGAYSKRRIWKKSEVKKKKEFFFTMFPILKKRKDQMAGTLSGGEQQMLALARGLMSEPEMLMVDEPSLGLAPILQKEVFSALQILKSQGKTIFLVEQMAWAALEICDRAYILQTGVVIRQGRGDELLKDSKLLEAYLGKKT